jgi:hypothetical protein
MTKINKKVSIIILGVVLAAGLISAGWLVWSKVVINPDRVFSDALNNSLRTPSVTRQVVQNQGTSGVEQVSHISFRSPTPNANTKTVIYQTTSTNTTASVETETIGTNDSDYVRYTEIKEAGGDDGTGGLGDLVGTWAERSGSNDPAPGQNLTFFNEGLFSIIPFGNLDKQSRDSLLSLINEKNLYQYTSAERKFENGRLVYVYSLNINPSDLVEILRYYMELTGNGEPAQLDPAEYENAPPIQIQTTVDVLSRQVVAINYPQNRTENYSGYGLYRPLEIPAETIPIEELQQRVQQS